MPLPTLFFTPLINLKHRIIGARRYRRSDKPHRCHYSAVTTPLSLHLCHYTSVNRVRVSYLLQRGHQP